MKPSAESISKEEEMFHQCHLPLREQENRIKNKPFDNMEVIERYKNSFNGGNESLTEKKFLKE